MNNATRIEASSFGAALTFNNELYIFGQSGVSKLEAVVNEFALGNGFGVVVNSKNQVCSFNINKMNPYVIDALEGKSIVKISAGE